MGLNLVQWAKHLGAFVMGTTSNKTKAQRVMELGADAVIDYTQEDFVQRVKELTDGKGADLIVDGVAETANLPGVCAVRMRSLLTVSLKTATTWAKFCSRFNVQIC